MAADFDFDIRVGHKRRRHDVENRVRVRLQCRAARLERHPTQHDRRLRFGREDRASGCIDPCAGCRPGAFVLSVVDAVAIGIGCALAPRGIHLGPRRCIGALVDAVGYAVVVAIDRTAVRVDGRTDRRVGTLVWTVRHAVSVAIGGTPLRVHASTGRRVGALIEAVVHTVSVRILRAAAGVDYRALDGVGTGVEPVVDLVAVGVARTPAGIDDGAGWRPGTRILPVGNPILIGVFKRAWPGKNRQPRRGDDVSRPVATGEPGAGSVDGASFEPEGDLLAQEDPVADGAMHGVVREVVAGTVAEMEPSVSAKDIEEVVLVAHVDDEAATPERQRRVRAAGPRRGLLVADIELKPDRRAEEVAETPATADLFLQFERAVVTRIRPERADFELMRVLTDAKGRNGVETQ